jgi:hypothetical protein
MISTLAMLMDEVIPGTVGWRVSRIVGGGW